MRSSGYPRVTPYNTVTAGLMVHGAPHEPDAANDHSLATLLDALRSTAALQNGHDAMKNALRHLHVLGHGVEGVHDHARHEEMLHTALHLLTHEAHVLLQDGAQEIQRLQAQRQLET